jgi:S-(hydroxymethyl)glutathione dehydrogenase/alcohol dehydrogenase
VKTIAAVLVETGKPLVLQELEIPVLKAGQVLVEIKFSGVCRTQLSECRGYRGKDPNLPHCLGHEGSGIVLEIGASVSKVKPGDRVLLSWMKGSGADIAPTTYQSSLGKVNAGSITTFMRHAVISENRVSVLPAHIEFRQATIFGCAVPTGIGAVVNTAQAKAGQSAVIFGAGGIGLCAIAGAAISGCSPVVAVDVNADKLGVAKAMGATHFVQVNGGNVSDELSGITAGGFDIAIEASGHTDAMTSALAAVRNQGGVAVVLGNARFGEKISVDPRELNHGKQLRGSWGGDNKPDLDFPKYFDLLHSGKLKVDELLARTYSLEDINKAIDDLEAGKVVRPLIEM